jgi:sugar/nucleoside kinase (ribokinase family)
MGSGLVQPRGCNPVAKKAVRPASTQWSDHPGLPVEVVDTVGAGDAFTAAMTMGFLAGLPLDEVNRRANAVAAYVCSQRGATPALPKADAVMVITGETDNP